MECMLLTAYTDWQDDTHLILHDNAYNVFDALYTVFWVPYMPEKFNLYWEYAEWLSKH